MPIEATGLARIRHKDTGVVYEIESGELDWEPWRGSERGMGPETLWQAKLEHPELGELRWEMAEYPVGAAGARSDDFNGHDVLENFDVDIKSGPNLIDDWPDFDNASNQESSAHNRVEAAEKMKEWFLRNYEDPANSLPYISAEGGYHWIHGGPTSVHEALGEEFGHPYPEDLIEEVADTLENEEGIYDWSPIPTLEFEDGEAIPGLDEDHEKQAELVSERLPLAEELLQNLKTGAFYVRPQEVAKPDLLAATLSQISDAIDDVLQFPSNGLREDSLEIRKLRRTLTKYADDPQRLEMDFTTCGASLTAKIVSEELPPSDTIDALISALRDGANGIRGTDPEIAKNRRILQEQALRHLPAETLDHIEKAAPVLKAITEGTLQEQLQEDGDAIAKELRTGQMPLPGVTRKDSILQHPDEAIRYFGRVSRVDLILKKMASTEIHKIDGSAPYKATRIITTLDALMKIAFDILKLFV